MMEDLEERVKRLEGYHPKPKPWYRHFGVWLAIVLTLGMLYMVYCFWMVESGYDLVLPF